MATRTAAQRREAARAEHLAYVAGCPARDLLDQIGNKWTTIVVTTLADGPLRHTELARRVAGASQKMLTQTLRTLERDGLLTRTVTPTVPARVDYALTDLGRDLLPILSAIDGWANTNIPKIDQARQEYDAGLR